MMELGREELGEEEEGVPEGELSIEGPGSLNCVEAKASQAEVTRRF